MRALNFGPKQFVGSVTNLIYIDYEFSYDIQNLSSDLCAYSNDMSFTSALKSYGEILFEEQQEWKICSKKLSYQVVFPVNVTWGKAFDTCTNIGVSHMSEISNHVDMNHAPQILHPLSKLCPFIWTPLSDEVEEGKFKSAVSGEVANFLPWADQEPNGERAQNNVVLDVIGQTYKDFSINYTNFCFVCTISKHVEIFLTGVCQHSYLGNS